MRKESYILKHYTCQKKKKKKKPQRLKAIDLSEREKSTIFIKSEI